MAKVTATASKGDVIISGYIAGGNIIISAKSICLDAIAPTSIDERELSSVYQMLKDQLNAQGKVHSEVVSLIKGTVEIDFSTTVDLDDLKYDLRTDGEAKINVTGDSDSHIKSLINTIRVNTNSGVDILIDEEKTRKGYESTYIRVYA